MPMHRDRERAGKELGGSMRAVTSSPKSLETHPAPVQLAGQ
jgi:hypothetical protein